ncbi:MAG TPA: CHAT domain-containing protein, partial [Pyrinomonadaceae bacterium]|nr:CHAT domain-containing protein [Pyrinomonadaceae bacterium]
LKQERDLQQNLSAKAAYQMRVLAEGSDSHEMEDVARELRDLTKAIQDLETRIKQQSPRYATLIQPQPLNLEQIQFELRDPNTLLLEYSLGDERSYAWAVTVDSVAAFELPGRAEIERSVGKVYQLLTARQAAADAGPSSSPDVIASADQEYWLEAAALSRTLLKPVAAKLERKRLVIVADGALQYIPFEALPEPSTLLGSDLESTGAVVPRPLMLQHEVLSLPSASILAATRRFDLKAENTDKLLAVLADPVFEKNDPRNSKVVAARDSAPGANASSSPGEPGNLKNINQSLNVPRLAATRQEAQAILGFAARSSRMMATDFDAASHSDEPGPGKLSDHPFRDTWTRRLGTSRALRSHPFAD